jgi:hypothetical protein
MTRLVDTKPALINSAIVASNVAIRSQTWSDAAQVNNAAKGAGSVLVVPGFIGDTIANQSSYTYRFRARPTLPESVLVWQVRCSAAVPIVLFTPTFSALQNRAAPSTTLDNPPVYVFDTYTAGTTNETEYTLTIASPAGGGSSIYVESIALIELPRTVLTSAEGGIPVNTQRVGDPISDVTGEGYTALCARVNAALSECRRVGQFHWFTNNPVVVLSTSFANLFSQGFMALNRKTTGTSATRTLSWRVYAQQASSNSGEVRLASAKNVTSTTVTVTLAPGLAWFPATTGAAAQIGVDAEDVSTAAGMPGGTFDPIVLSARVTGTLRSVSVYGISVWEDTNDV